MYHRSWVEGVLREAGEVDYYYYHPGVYLVVVVVVDFPSSQTMEGGVTLDYLDHL